jgi:outer membrane protein TolC
LKPDYNPTLTKINHDAKAFMMIGKQLFMSVSLVFLSHNILAQKSSDTVTEVLSLDGCIHYAVKNQPALKQSQIDEGITKASNFIALSGWLPQANVTGIFQHYYDLPTAFFTDQSNPSGPKTPVHTGLYNNFTPELSVTQTIFNPDVLYASGAAHLYTKQAAQNTDAARINLISNVSKAFYDVLLTQQQMAVLKDDTARLNKNQQDAYHEYVSGIVDKVDYEQATISLNNSLSQLISTQNALKPKYAALKQLMGYPQEKGLNIQFDTAIMMQEILFDTSRLLDYNNRIEYQQLTTGRRLQKALTDYYRYGFLPSVSASYNYFWLYANDQYSQLYNKTYPYSYLGLNFSFPLFQGFKRLENIHRSKLQESRQDWDVVNLKLEINTEYQQALANYKSNLYNLYKMQENKQLARDVYNIVKLQYREGVKTYLNVITAESDLRNSEISYLNALFQLLMSKIDLQKAMGDISPDI